MYQLRPYQERALNELNEVLSMGARAPLLVAPTGAGKTVLAAEIIRQRPRERILFLAPRRELIYQTSRKLWDIDVRHGIILAGHRAMDRDALVQVGSVDTLIARTLKRNTLDLEPFNMLIVDEAHVGLTDTREQLITQWPDAKIVGLTATPCRTDGKALGRVYDELIEVATVKELTELGFLAPAIYFAPSEPDLRGVRTTAGDYNKKDLDRAVNKPKLIGDIVEHWLKHAYDRRTVVFATSIDHSAALAAQFLQNGVSAEHVDANTPQSERDAIFARFSAGVTQVLCNCTLASIGFDLPDLDCVVLARPTKSLGLYLQCLGRGLRVAEGKKNCLVLDHAGVVNRFGFADEERYWTLHGKYAQDELKIEYAKKEREKKEIKQMTCPECAHVFWSAPQCPHCGYVWPVRGKPVETFDGELIQLGGQRNPLQMDRQAFYLMLVGFAKQAGYSYGWAAHKFKERTGDWPDWKWKNYAERNGGITPSAEVLAWIKSRQIAWMRSRGKKYGGRAFAARSGAH